MRWRGLVIWPLVALGLAGCATIDDDQARLCRIALPALEPAETRITLRRLAAIERGIRIEYVAERTGAPPLARFVECRFALGRRQTIEAIATDRGQVPGATVYFLRRYYIETPEGVAADPGPPPPETPSWILPAGALFIVFVIAIMLRLRALFARTRQR